MALIGLDVQTRADAASSRLGIAIVKEGMGEGLLNTALIR